MARGRAGGAGQGGSERADRPGPEADASSTGAGAEPGASPDLDELRRALKLARSARRKASRECARLRRHNEMLEEHLTGLVQEIGQLKVLSERAEVLERQLSERDEQIAQLQAEVARLRAAISSGRPTALAAAAAAARVRRSPLLGPRR